MSTNNERIAQIVSMAMNKNPEASINDLCRACKDAKVGPVSKPLVASIRRAVIKATIGAAYDQAPDVVTPDGAPARLVRVRVPAAVQRDEALRADPADLARERAEKQARDAEREVEWRARAAEKERAWAEEREREDREAAERQARDRRDAEAALATLPPPVWPTGPGEPARPEPTNAEIVPALSTRPKNAAERAARRQALNEMLDADPGIDPLLAIVRLKERFGGALDAAYVYETCRIARQIHGLPTLNRRDESRGRHGGTPSPLPTFPAPEGQAELVELPPDEDDESAFALTPEEELAWLVRQARDIMRQHRLVELVLTMTETTGEWEFRVAPRTERGSVKF